MNTLRNRILTPLKKITWFYRPVATYYHKFIEPLFNGYYKYMFRYYIFERNKDIEQLKKSGFLKIKIFAPRTWRIGRGVDKVFRRYYTAVFNSKTVFVKIAKDDLTVLNEIHIHYKIRNIKWKFTPNCVAIDEQFADSTKMIAIEYIDGLHEIEMKDNNDVINDFYYQVTEILNELKNVGLVHGDFHKGNLMQDPYGQLILMDFGISKFINQDNTVNYDQRPGTFYRIEKNRKIYDDAFSVIQFLNFQNSVKSYKDHPSYKKILKSIGDCSFTVPTKHIEAKFPITEDILNL